jgi:cell division protein FtsI (penicillin-binding protein 3)
MTTRRRLWLTTVCSMVAFLLVVMRLGYLQIYCHAALSNRAQREHGRKIVDQVPRGAILDRNGGVLAMSIQGGALFADPAMVERADETARLIAPLVNISPSAIKARLTQKRRFVWIARRLDPETAHKIQEMKRPGLTVVSEMKRFYPEETLGSHLLGIVSEEQKGLSGVELAADRWLTARGTPFLFKQWSLAKKGSHTLRSSAEVVPQSVVLTIDKKLQYIVEQQLATQMKLTRPKTATVIVQDPQTGEILAMATAPTFDPNSWGLPGHGGGPDALKNPAVEHVVEPGSTFKAITAAAAIEQHLVTPGEVFNCENGSWELQGRKFRDHEKDGMLTFTQVIARSSNIGTAKVALRLGQNNLYRYARAFGFGISSGCGLPGDGSGILRSPQQWQVTSVATISFGQEIGTTPLQMVNAFSAIANGGSLLEPRLFKGVVDDDGDYREWEPSAPLRRVISMGTAMTVRKLLRDVVVNGTGKEAQVAGIPVAGKTGTAQKIDPKTRQYSPDKYLASFIGFAPADNPKLVIGVFLDEPQGNYWGGSEAAPLFGRIVRDAASYLHFDQTPVGPLAATRVVPRS